MIKNYLIIAFRSIWRSKLHSTINVLGLGVGITCCLLIALYLKDEWSFDSFHTKSKSIYRAYVKEDYGANQTFFNTVTPYPLANALKENFGEIVHSVRIQPFRTEITVNNKQFNERLLIADQHFFEAFDFPVIRGDKPSLGGINDIILSRDIAAKYFGDADPLNKTLTVKIADKDESFIVKAVTENVPGNSSIQFDLLISSLNFPKLVSEQALTSGWFNVTPETYVLLQPGVDATALQSKFPALFKSILGDEYEKSKYTVGLQPLEDIHLDTEYPTGISPVSDPQYSYILGGVALLVLFLACINFVTLAIGRSIKRAREVGIRKVVGAVRAQLIGQFIGEAVLVTFIALLIGAAGAGVGLPLFNELSGKTLTLEWNAFTLLCCLAFLLVIGLCAGSYPAFVLSAFKPISILKGPIQGNNKNSIRKILVGVQLVLAVFLVSSTIVMQGQLSFLQNKNLGFDEENMMTIQLSGSGTRFRDIVANAFDKGKLYRQEFESLPQVASVSIASHDFGDGNWTNVGYTDEAGTYRTFFMNVIDEHYIPDMNISMASGRNFVGANASDATRGVIVNEAFVREYQFTNPVGQRIPGKNFADHEIIGVVKDFNYASLYTQVEPLVMVMNSVIVFSGSENVSMNNSPIPKLMIRLHKGQTGDGIAAIEKLWKKLTNGDDFQFAFVDERLNEQYRNDMNLGRILRIATILSILIGSLGLYALASLAMQSRVKEICIRKLLGATPDHLLGLLSKEFIVMMVICLVASAPLTWYVMNRWLDSFAYKIDMSMMTFISAGLTSIVVALLTISYHAIKTVNAEPAQILKNE